MNKTKRIIEILKDRNCDFIIELSDIEDLAGASFEIKIKVIGELSDEFESIGAPVGIEASAYKQEIEELIRSLYPLQ